jgi:hypothetical protein
MRPQTIVLFAAANACGGGTQPTALQDGPPVTIDARPVFDASQPDAPPPDAAPPSITDWKSKDPTPLLSMAGTWIPVTAANTSIVSFWGVARLGTSQRQGVVLGGWGFHGANSPRDATPVTVGIFAQQANGTLAPLESPPSLVTNGEGSVNVADFNGDGKDDIFLAAHNESPFVNKASTVYLSKPDGTLNKLTLGDAVQDHDATLATIGGAPMILAMSFGQPTTPPGNPLLYTFNSTGFDVVNISPNPGDAPAGQSVAAADFLGDGKTEVIVGDMGWGLGIPYTGMNIQQQYILPLVNKVLVLPPMPMPAPYFNKPQYDAYMSQWPGKTHNSRIWVDDLNQDGRPDVIVNAEIWSGSAGLQRNTLQLLISQGGLTFTDETDTLNPDYDLGSMVDYSLRIVDVDGSGIASYLESSSDACNAGATCMPAHGNYILVNDGSGRLHVAMHDEFLSLKSAVARFIAAQNLPGIDFNSGEGLYAWTPRFIAYQNAAGRINFVAVMQVGVPSGEAFAVVNLPLEIDLATQYREDLTVLDRNGSKHIRTFAGNDTIYAKNSGTPCMVDGGTGTDTAVYPGKKADYAVTKTATGWTVVGPQVNDTLKNVEILQFADGTMQ